MLTPLGRFMFKYIFILLIGILLVISFTKESPKMNTLQTTDTVLALGDSITYGFGADTIQSYPYFLSQKTGLNIINAGVNGDTSEEGLARVPQLLHDKSIKLILLCFGGNDLLQKKSQADIKSNLKKMIHLAKMKNIPVILISVPNISVFGLQPLELYEELAEEENVELVEGLLTTILSRSSLKSDYIHPNAKGYKQMADEIYIHLQDKGWIK